MEILSIIFISLALSLDAFSVSITCGIKLSTIQIKKYLRISLMFGLFQAVMPVGGWLIGLVAKDLIQSVANWVSFSIFLILGLKTIYESSKIVEHKCDACGCQNWACLLGLSVATSIDAFLVGIVLSLYKTPLFVSLPMIGIITFAMSFGGCFIGNKATLVSRKRAFQLAGIILILLAVKSLDYF
jgi:manganese efflux pump family protein